MTKELKFKTKKDGTKIVEPDTHLKKIVNGASIKTIITDANLKAANDFIEEESKKFPEEMYGEMQELSEAFVDFRNTEFVEGTGKSSSPSFQGITTFALAIKSSSGMYGYELASAIARSLFDFAENHKCTDTLGKKILGVHVNALKVVFYKKISGDGGPVGKQLTSELKELVAQDKTRGVNYSGSNQS
jgi:hypothetical protein